MWVRGGETQKREAQGGKALVGEGGWKVGRSAVDFARSMRPRSGALSSW